MWAPWRSVTIDTIQADGFLVMINGVVLLWFVLAALALLFVMYDIRTTPESPVLKWGFVLLTAYTGVLGAFLYVARLS